jgi:hypothetical protein
MTTLVNRAKMSTTTTGTGTITLGSAVSGYQTFAAAGVANTNVVRYTIEDGSAWEIGTGTYTATGTTLTRTPTQSSNAGAAINLSGNAQVYVTAAAADILQPDNNLSDLLNTTTARTNLGLGTMATQNAASVAITGGTAVLTSVTGASSSTLSVVGSPITFTVGGTERMRVHTGGSVGIGESAPSSSSALTVRGSAPQTIVKGGSSGVDSQIVFQDSTGSPVGSITFNSTGLTLTSGSSTLDMQASNGDVTLSGGTSSARLYAQQFIGGYNDTTGSANVTNMQLNNHRLTKVLVSASLTLTSSVPPAGTAASIIIQTSGTSSRIVTFGTGFKSQGILATGTVANRFFVVEFISDGTALFETGRTTTAYA